MFAKSIGAVRGGAFVMVALTLMAGPAAALDVCLRAEPVINAYPDGLGGTINVTMWGYAEAPYVAPACDWASAGPTEVPGPEIDVAVGDSTLNIHLQNALPAGTPTSVVIIGQSLPPGSGPVRVGGRIQSAVHETESINDNAAAEGLYSWSSLAPGTYLYRTGTHPQVQQQMGLYGAVTHDSAAGEAYPGVAYVDDVVLLYSEIDPALHETVANDCFGDPMPVGCPDAGTWMTSTIEYNPVIYLINGEPFDPLVAGSNEFAVTQNSNTLLRLLNAGLTSHAPTTYGLRMNLVAEDGSLYPFPRSQYSALLPAGKALDAIIQPPDPVRYALVDRMMALTNNGVGPGGMMAFLQASAVPNAPVANNDSDGTTEDHPVSMNVAGNDTVTAPAPTTIDVATVTVRTGPFHGSATPDGAGNVDYAPDANYYGPDSFTYTIDDTDGRTSNAATVSITVDPVNDAPVAVADSYTVVEGQVLNVAAPGVLGNDSDVDVDDMLAAVQDTGTVTLNADGSFNFDATSLLAGATDSFTYHVNDQSTLPLPDGPLDSAIVTVTITVTPTPANVAPVAIDDAWQVVKGTTVPIPVLDNDYDTDGTLVVTSVQIIDGPNHGKGVVTAQASGVITYEADPNYGGTELFTYRVMDDDGEWSNTAKVKVNLVNAP